MKFTKKKSNQKLIKKIKKKIIENLFFDLDDTLLPTQDEYNAVSLQVALLIQKYINIKSLSTEDIIAIKKEIDLELVKTLGLSTKRFPTSWVMTFRSLVKKYQLDENVFSTLEDDIYDSAADIFRRNIEPYNNVHKVLEVLSKDGYNLNLLTAGDETIQHKRVKDAKIEHYFQKVFIYPHKTPDTLQEVLHSFEPKLQAKNCVMIGNSLRSDIHPALTKEMTAIHIERETWGYDKYEVDTKNSNYFKINSLDEIPNLLNQINDKRIQ